MTCIHLQRVYFYLKAYSNEEVVRHGHYSAHLFEIHLSVQAPFHGAGVEESTVIYVAAPKILAAWKSAA